MKTKKTSKTSKTSTEKFPKATEQQKRFWRALHECLYALAAMTPREILTLDACDANNTPNVLPEVVRLAEAAGVKKASEVK